MASTRNHSGVLDHRNSSLPSLSAPSGEGQSPMVTTILPCAWPAAMVASPSTACSSGSTVLTSILRVPVAACSASGAMVLVRPARVHPRSASDSCQRATSGVDPATQQSGPDGALAGQVGGVEYGELSANSPAVIFPPTAIDAGGFSHLQALGAARPSPCQTARLSEVAHNVGAHRTQRRGAS